MTYTRAQYMNKEVSHQDYYASFCTESYIQYVIRTIGGDRIKASTNINLNDIPLKEWDSLETMTVCMIGTSIRQAEGQVSLSSCVCAAKAAALIWLNQELQQELNRKFGLTFPTII